ncbi:alpha/beta hydrolase family protein [Paenibacillus sp. DMB20]|uniref:alpha/beta hydrolase family protein n=1 Tax=Paenibacillus sp. DMB20 TaxID=1642570 RepID=UPI0006275CF6|nr:hypothetical protein [Paenibacillus sp. DMB20]KKO54161.1 hypothetical protein XI25_08850 [Paenibacillus sp. DMB20]
MRLFEWIIALSSIGMLWHVIWSRKQLKGSALKIFSMITCIVLHLIVEGGRWQMAPAYLLCAIVLLVYVIRTLRPSAVPGKGKLAKIALSTAAVPFTLLAIGLPVLFPVFALNQPSGPYPVGTITFEWTDETRESASGKPRKINVQIWYPAKITDSSEMAPYIDKLPILAKAMKEQFSTPEWMFNYLNLIQTNTYLKADFADVNDKKLPVVFFSHSNLLGARFTNTFQTSELASHGYIVASIEHPRTAFTAAYSDGSYVAFEDFFSRLPMEFEVQNKASIPVIKDQVRDIEFALGQMKKLDHAADNPFAGKIDFLKIGLFGHSFGGAPSSRLYMIMSCNLKQELTWTVLYTAGTGS